MPKIAILGWGSLIWESHPEFDIWHREWLRDGPVLALEFSRISRSRNRALTLVIDDLVGAPCTVEYTLSRRTDPCDAICDLRCREGTTLRNIGVYFADESRPSSAMPTNLDTWAKEKQFDVVVWTALKSNFQEEATSRKPFSIPEAISHLRSLAPEGKVKAAEYVWRAPSFVQTPLRKALENEPWFALEQTE